jgi:hypothetical protein
VIFNEINISSITVSATGGGFANLDTGISGIYFRSDRDEYGTLVSSDWVRSNLWTPYKQLTPNTSYYFSANTRNAGGIENELTDIFVKATRIEKAQGVKFGSVTSTSIDAACDGSFTGLASPGSGVIVYCVTSSTDSGWQATTSYFTVAGLSPNTLYAFKADSRNRAGLNSGETPAVSTYTKASAPLASVFTEITTTTIRASWSSGMPANSDNTEYRVEASSVSSSGPYNYYDGWNTSVYRDFIGLSANTKFYFSVKARNFAGIETEKVDLGEKYTRIEQIQNADYIIQYTSITIIVARPRNFEGGNSGVIFSNQTTGYNSGWTTNLNCTFTELTQNSTYVFTVNTKNGDGVDNTPFTLPQQCSLINPATSIVFGNITPTSVSAKPAGDFPINMGLGDSGIAVEGDNSDLGYSSYTWSASDDYRTFVGLSTNTRYAFRANSRNQYGIVNSSTQWVYKYTAAAAPGAVSVSTTPVANNLKITGIAANSNPASTEFALAFSTNANFSSVKYILTSGSTSDVPGFTADWGFALPVTVSGLCANTTYYFKASARNGDGIVSSYGPVSSRVAQVSIPVISSVVPQPDRETSAIAISYSGEGSSYWIQYSTVGIVPDYVWHDLYNQWLTQDTTQQWTDTGLVNQLGPDVIRYYRVKARNIQGMESDYSDAASTCTWATVPAYAGDSVPDVSSVTVHWSNGQNSSNTRYQARISRYGYGTGIVEISPWSSGIYQKAFEAGILPNTSYFIDVTAENQLGILATSWLQIPVKYTLIEDPAVQWLMIGESSVTAKAVKTDTGESLNNLTSTAGNIKFKLVKPAGESDLGWLATDTLEVDIPPLSANTTYGIKVTARNNDLVLNPGGEQGAYVFSTNIEAPSGANFIEVTTGSIKLAPKAEYTNLDKGNSGVIIYRRNSAGGGDIDNSGWAQSPAAWSPGGDLSPNRAYYFRIASRNRNGNISGELIISTYTLASSDNPLEAASWYSSGNGYYSEIKIDSSTTENPTGPGGTEFALTSDNGASWIGAGGSTTTLIYWSTETTRTHINLEVNTTYTYRVKARNGARIETGLTVGTSVTTPPGRAQGIVHTLQGPGSLKLEWAAVASASGYSLNLTSSGWSGSYASVQPNVTVNSLMANTSYAWYVTAENVNGAGGPSVSGSAYTSIEAPQGVEYGVVNSTTVSVRASGAFSNLTSWQSGWRAVMSQSSGDAGIISTTTWKSDTSYASFSTVIQPNTSYYVKAQARNGDGDETIWSSYRSTVTPAVAPSAAAAAVAPQNSVKVTLSSGSVNPVYTQYAIYNNTEGGYLQTDGSVSDIAAWQPYAVWGGTAGIVNKGLSGNTVYAYKVKARSITGQETEWSAASNAVRTTGISEPAGLAYSEVSTNSIRANWSANANPSGSKYHIESSTSSDYAIIISSNWWTPDIVTYVLSPLMPNRKYVSRVRAKDSAEVSTSAWVNLGEKYTKIESPSGITFTVTSTSITATAQGNISNISEGLSGILFEETRSGSNSTWLPAPMWEKAGLIPNTTYSFTAKSRNGEGVSNEPIGPYSTCTLCALPVMPILSKATTNTITIVVDNDSNPDYTVYAIAVTSDNWATTKYVQSDGRPGLAAVWKTRSAWGGNSGIAVTGLNSGSEYRYKVKAKNVSGIDTQWGTEATQRTTGGPEISAAPDIRGMWTSVSTISFTCLGSEHYHYRYNQQEYDTACSTDAYWNGTIIIQQMNSEGFWWLHVRGENGDNSAAGYADYGPIEFDGSAPVITEVYCQYSSGKVTTISSVTWTQHDTPYFRWTAPESVSPVAGYSYSFSGAETEPDDSIDTITTNFESTAPVSAGKYYFSVKAKNLAGNWGATSSFVYDLKPANEESGSQPTITSSGAVPGLPVTAEGITVGAGISVQPAAVFGKTMEKASVESATTLVAVRDNLGNVIGQTISGTAVYDVITKKVTFVPVSNLIKGYTYELVVGDKAKDVFGNELGKEVSLKFATVMDKTARNVVIGADEKTKIELPANALGADGYVLISTTSVTQVPGPGANGDEYSYPVSVRQFDAYTGSHTLQNQFNGAVKITIPYTDADNDGIVDEPAGSVLPEVQVKTLGVHWYDDVRHEYVKLTSEANRQTRTISAETGHFSIFAVLGSGSFDTTASYAYPVPYKPSAGHIGIKFGKGPDNLLPSDCRIRVYTVAGRHVKTIEHASNYYEWLPVETEDGEPVSSGVYIYVIESRQNKKFGKLMIVR